MVRLASGPLIKARSERGWTESSEVLLAVRAERVQLRDTDGENSIGARIQSHVYVGSTHQYLLSTPDGMMRVESPREVSGPEVRVHLPPEAIVILPGEADAFAPMANTEALLVAN
jgi:ABC-type Fe3+/spermidine/putrescine transport system ATPase subunit